MLTPIVKPLSEIETLKFRGISEQLRNLRESRRVLQQQVDNLDSELHNTLIESAKIHTDIRAPKGKTDRDMFSSITVSDDYTHIVIYPQE